MHSISSKLYRGFKILSFVMISANLYGQHAIKFKTLDTLSYPFDTIVTSVAINNYTTSWSNTTYNPYKKNSVQFPIHISFKDSLYHSPIPRKKVITSRYGWRNRRAHKGIDIDLITGDSVFAILPGKIRYVKYHSGHGKTIVVRHENGLETVYAHLSKYLVKVNDTVKKGQVIGKGGNTGHSTGSHLHLEVHYKGVSINPEILFSFDESNKIRQQNNWVPKYWATPYFHRSTRQSKIQLYASKNEAIASEAKTKIFYTVKRGDTLSRISHKYSVSIASICKTNAIKPSSVIKIGQNLVLLQ
ncbi:peptidoglycan DD-metalloendopeptidase family protein [Wenyingzhuangia sp. IMCC45574]